MALLDCPFPDGYFTVPNDESGEKRKITFPMISPMILVNTIYTVIDSFTSKSNQVMTYINRIYQGTTKDARVLSSAMSWVYFLVVLLLIAAVTGLISMFVFYQRKD